MKILVVEDEKTLAEVLKDSLEKEKYKVDVSYDGEEGEYNALTGVYDLILLDVMLLYKNGFDILKSIRDENIESKVIMLTAKSELEDKLNGLQQGADDYITKPFHIEEVIARVNIQLRKNNTGKVKDYIEFSDIKLDLKKMILECTTNNETIELGNKEFQLLEYFINNPNLVLSKEQIYDKVWGIDRETESNNLEAYLSFIRRKLKAIGAISTIKSLRGLGYRLENKDEETKD